MKSFQARLVRAGGLVGGSFVREWGVLVDFEEVN